jgi:hypothetical protein
VSAGNKSIKDKEMAAMLKRNGVERETGRCPICYGFMPNGTFYPARADQHIISCPGPQKRGGSNGPVSR